MKTYLGRGSIPPHILNLGTGWGWVVSLTLRSLCPPYPPDINTKIVVLTEVVPVSFRIKFGSRQTMRLL